VFVNQIGRGVYKLSIETLEGIADVPHISISYILLDDFENNTKLLSLEHPTLLDSLSVDDAILADDIIKLVAGQRKNVYAVNWLFYVVS